MLNIITEGNSNIQYMKLLANIRTIGIREPL